MGFKTKDCFSSAKKAEEKGRKHKGLLVVKPNDKEAEQYISKAKTNLRTCELFKEKRLDYKTLRNFWGTKNFLGNFLVFRKNGFTLCIIVLSQF